jgi:hypothetical protein
MLYGTRIVTKNTLPDSYQRLGCVMIDTPKRVAAWSQAKAMPAATNSFSYCLDMWLYLFENYLSGVYVGGCLAL